MPLAVTTVKPAASVQLSIGVMPQFGSAVGVAIVLSVAVATDASADCSLAGIWHTDVERSAETVHASTEIDESKKAAIISILDEFEWEITCDRWTIRHIGDHTFPEPVEETSDHYELLQEDDLLVAYIGGDAGPKSGQRMVIRYDDRGCIALTVGKGMLEFKCRVG